MYLQTVALTEAPGLMNFMLTGKVFICPFITRKYTHELIFTHALGNTQPYTRDDHKFSEMIGQKPLIVILSLNLIGHPYIALER